MLVFENANTLNGMKVLIVDDIAENIDLLGHFLEKCGLIISIAMDGEKALELVGKVEPDLILLDVMMPKLNGFEVCEILKKNEKHKHIPIIFITALAEMEYVTKGFQVGGADYISKPFQEEEVICRVNSQLKLLVSQNALVRQEKLYRTIVEKIPTLIFKVDPNLNISFVNPAFMELGYGPRDLVGNPLKDIINQGDNDKLVEEIATKEVGPLAPTGIEVEFKTNGESDLYQQMPSLKVAVDSVGIWNLSDEEVFKGNKNKKFLGTLCIANIL
jgi:PAS domain S-box-containing protein